MSDSTTIELPEELSINTVDQWHPVFCQAIDQHRHFNFQSNDLCRIDSAGLQLLLAFITQVINSGKTYHWLSVAPTLQHQAQTLGLDHVIFGQQTSDGDK